MHSVPGTLENRGRNLHGHGSEWALRRRGAGHPLARELARGDAHCLPVAGRAGRLWPCGAPGWKWPVFGFGRKAVGVSSVEVRFGVLIWSPKWKLVSAGGMSLMGIWTG